MKKLISVLLVVFFGVVSQLNAGQYGQNTKKSHMDLNEWMDKTIGYKTQDPVIRSVGSSETTSTKSESTFGDNVSVYVSDPKDPKTYGRKIRVEYPKGWEAKPGVSPHNVYKFTDKQYQTKDLRGRACVITIVDIGENLSRGEWWDSFEDEYTMREMFGVSNMKITNSKAIHADNLPAYMMTSEVVQDQLGIKLYSKTLSVIVGYKNTGIFLQCLASGKDKKTAESVFDSSKGMFLSFMNSFKCMDRWETQDGDTEYSVGEKLSSIMDKDMNKQDWQNAADLVIENVVVGEGVCLKTQQDLDNLKRSPEVFLAYSFLNVYYMFTYHIQKYCEYSGAPKKFISRIEKSFASNKRSTEDIIRKNMGEQYLSCLTNDILNSEDNIQVLQYYTGSLQDILGVTKKEMCNLFNEEYFINDATEELKTIYENMGL